MSEIDNRIVSMQFDNESFERKLADTISSLDKLTASIENLSDAQGLQDLGQEMDSFNISAMGEAIDNISGKLSAMGAVGFSVISNLTNQFLGMAQDVSHDVLGPIITGGKARANNIEQAKFQFRGLGLDVQAEMDSALAAVKGTAFGLDEAAKAAAQFGASGITAGADLTGALRAIAGTAAMTNTSFSEIAQIFTSSAGSGKVNNQDLLQFATRGLNASAAVAKQMGITEAQVHEMAAAGKLDFKTFAKAMDEAFGEHATAANETYSGSLSNMHAAMSRLGASFFGPKAEQMRDIFNALTPVIDNINAALQPLIKTFLEFGQILTFKLVSFLSNIDLEPLTVGILYITAAIQNLHAMLEPILATLKWSFREVFPKGSESIIIKITRAISNFTAKIKIGSPLLDKLHIIFKGFFAALAIGKEIIKDAVGTFKALFGQLSDAAGFSGSPILDFLARIGDSISKVKGKLVEGGEINAFFMHLAYFIKQPLELIDGLRDKLVGMFDKVSVSASGPQGVGTEDILGRIGQRMEQLRDIAGGVVDAWQRFTDFLSRIKPVLDEVFGAIGDWFKDFGNKLADAFGPGDFNSAIDLLNVGLLGGIIVMFKKFFDGDLLTKIGAKPFMDKFDALFKGVQTTMSDFQAKLKADTLMRIAKAIGILTISVVALSLVDSANLAKALSAIAVGFGQLAVMMKLMDKLIGDKMAAAKIAALAGAMVTMAVAIDLMVPAIFALSRIKMGDLAKGLLGVGTGLAILVAATRGMTALGGAKMIAAGVGMTAMAGGLILMSIAVRQFGGIDWGVLGKGLLGVAGALFVITVGMSEMPLNLPITAAGLVILSAALIGMAEGLKAMGSIDWATMGRGLAGVAATLFLISVAMDSMPITLPVTAAGMVILAGALVIMAKAVGDMGALDAGVIGKGIAAIAAMLLILDAAMQGMEGALPGAAALLVVASSLVVLAQVLEQIGNMDNERLVQALLGIAGVLSIVALGGVLVEGALPGLIGLAVALDLIAAAVFVFGAGSLLFAKSMEIMATAGIAGTKGFLDALELLVKAIPRMIAAVILGITESIGELVAALPLVTRLIEAVLLQLLDTIIKLAPKVGEALGVIVLVGLALIQKLYPEFVKTGFGMLMAMLHGISDNIGEITTTVAKIIVNFLDALSEKVPEIVDAVFNLWITVLTTVVHKLGETMPSLMPILAIAFIDGLLDGFKIGFTKLNQFFVDLPGRLLDALKGALGITGNKGFLQTGIDMVTGLWNGATEAFVGVLQWFGGLPDQIIGAIGDLVTTLVPKGIEIITGFLDGAIQKGEDVINWFTGIPEKVIGLIGDLSTKLKDKGTQLISGLYIGALEKWGDVIGFLEGLPQKAVDSVVGIKDILYDTGLDVLQGLWDGMKDKWDDLTGWLQDLDPRNWFNDINPKKGHAIKNLVGTGEMVFQGLQNGMQSGWDEVTDWLKSLDPKEHITDSLNKTFDEIVAQLGDLDDLEPTVTPVLDLSQVKAAAKGIPGLMDIPSLAPDVSFDNARLISATATLDKTTTDAADQQPAGDLTFIQNNHSPEPLSTHDIYRNTKSIMATAKEELGIA